MLPDLKKRRTEDTTEKQIRNKAKKPDQNYSNYSEYSRKKNVDVMYVEILFPEWQESKSFTK